MVQDTWLLDSIELSVKTCMADREDDRETLKTGLGGWNRH
jgi:hypothetical protein